MISRLLSQFIRGRIAGHPIHSMLVHFPSALFPMSLLFDVLSLFLQDSCLCCAAFYCLAAGVIMAIIAACFGAIDYARVPAEHPAWNKASLHALLNITWIILFSIVFGLKLKHYPKIEFADTTQIIISTLSVAGLIFSNYLGGDLVFKHKLGFDEETKE